MSSFVASLVLIGSARAEQPDRPRREEITQGLPPWMTHGEEIRLAVVDELLKSGNTYSALDILRVMREEGLNGPEVDLRQGIALRKDGVTSESERLLLQAKKRMHGDARAAAELCILYADLHRLDDAIEMCQDATRVAEPTAAAWNNLGFLLLAADRPEEAVAAAEKAVQGDATDAMYRNNLGMVQAALGRDDQAFRTLSSTMSKADAAYMVGLAIEDASGAELARRWFDRALDLDPTHPQTLEHLEPPAAQTTESPSPVSEEP